MSRFLFPPPARYGLLVLGLLFVCQLFCTSVVGADEVTSNNSQRVRRGLQALYQFDEADGRNVHDTSGVGHPLDLTIENPERVQWFPNHLVIQAATRIRSNTPATKMIEAVKASHELTVEVWINPGNLQQSGPARIVSISANASERNLTLGQQGEAYDLRLRTKDRDKNGMPSMASPAKSVSTEVTHVVFCKQADGVGRIYINGEQTVQQQVGDTLVNWNEGMSLILGNEATDDRPWLGQLHLVALYSEALTVDEVQQNFRVGSEQLNRLVAALPPAARQTIDFVKQVQPILRERCFECHSAGNEEGGLNLAIKSRAFEGGEHGPAIKRGQSLTSLLMYHVSGIDEEAVMPPEGDRLTDDQLSLLRAWIDQGADWPAGADVLDPRLEKAREHWAFRRLTPVEPPNVENETGWIQTDVDRFILKSLTDNQLQPTPPIDARGLVRRLYFGLTGLPPTPDEIDEFVKVANVDRASSIAELVDQLLASQHYGERWGRHWLDVARYADSDGQEADRDRPTAYRYRDFVIRALNSDMPFDQFVRWQIAGDEYAPDDAQAIAATGFLTSGTHTVLADTFLEEERLRNRYNELDDIVSTLGTGMLGLTVGCARCHDHKYDAFSAREYYRLLSAFHSGDRQKVRLPNGKEALAFQDFSDQPQTTWLFQRGDFFNRDLQVKLGFPVILSVGKDAQNYLTSARNHKTRENSTYQRRALADWMTDVENGAGPLLARVIVNRVWQHHFGNGIVRTVDDFGVRSEDPTHPELLEWLVEDFIAHDWSVKHLQRNIVLSAVYQQDVTFDDSKLLIDPDNRLLWRRQPQRLEAEILRDAMLAVSGTLNLKAYGPAFKPPISPEANLARNLKGGGYPTDAKDEEKTRRRSVYMFHKRLVPYPLFQAFDRPDLLQSCGERISSTVAPQALAILNDEFVRLRSADFAQRLINECGNDDHKLIDRAFELSFGRRATESEQSASMQFIQGQTAERAERQTDNPCRQAITDYCQSLFGLNEFIYVD